MTDTEVRGEIRFRVEEFVRKVCEFDGAELTDDTSLAEIDIDSLELVTLAQELQRDYGVALNDERLLGLELVGQMVDLVAARVEAARGAAAQIPGTGAR